MVDRVLAGEIPLSRAVKEYKPMPAGKKGRAKGTPFRTALKRLIRQTNDTPSVVELLTQALAELDRIGTEAANRQ